MAKKFIIITTARSGSQMLVEFLNKQKNIRCEDELLQMDKEEKFKNLIRRLPNINLTSIFGDLLGEKPSRFVENRNKNFREYLEVWENVLPCKYFGFKIFFKNHIDNKLFDLEKRITQDSFLTYVKQNDISIIHLTRDNMLLKYISEQVSRITKVWTSIKSDHQNTDLVKVEIPYGKFKHFRNARLEEDQSVTDFCYQNDIKYYHTTYENLTGENYAYHYKSILEFLGEDPTIFVDINNTYNQKNKQNTFIPIECRVSNLDELVEKATKANNTEILEDIKRNLSKS